MDPIYRNGNKHPANGQHFGKKIMLTPSLKRGTNPVQKYIGKFPCCQWSARYWKLKSFHLTNHLNKNHLSTRQYGFQKNLSADWSAAFHHGQRTCVLAPDIEGVFNKVAPRFDKQTSGPIEILSRQANKSGSQWKTLLTRTSKQVSHKDVYWVLYCGLSSSVICSTSFLVPKHLRMEPFPFGMNPGNRMPS